MGLEQTYNRYRRTLLGPFWIATASLSTGFAIAFVFGGLLGGDWREFLPHILGGVTCWLLVSGMVVEGSTIFIGAAGMMQVQRLPLSFHRDVAFLISTAFGAMFLLTPVFWKRAQLPDNQKWIVDYNPFAHLLEILRQPLVGQMAPLVNWQASLGILAFSGVLAVVSLMLFRKRVVFWL
jgi:ABC-type polysaccharide/polyol phosphate export permease